MFDIFFAAYEKLLVFRWSFLVVFGIFVICRIYIGVVSKIYKNEIKSIEWIKANSFKYYFLFGFPTLLIIAPTLEELIFRAPLLLFFDGLSPSSIIFAVIISLSFGATHWHSPFSDGMQLLDKAETDDLVAEAAKVRAAEPRYNKIFRVFFTSSIGLYLSYLALSSQSIWPSLIFHSAWNFLWPLIGPLVMALLFYSVLYVYDFVDSLLRKLHRKVMKIINRQNRFST